MDTDIAETETESPGEATAEASTAARVVTLIPRTRIAPSPTNPRTAFDQTKLQELAVSIEAYGIMSPVLVRPAPIGGEAHYELVLGERRWRAAEIAGLDLIPAFVAQMTAVEAAERQLVENSQRVDVTPLEEGRAYKRLIEQHGHTIESLMAKVGRSRSHLYARIKLTSLAPGVQRALEDGRLGAAIAELIATIGDPKLQEQACRVVIGEGRDEELAELGIAYEVIEKTMRQPLSYRAAKDVIRGRFMLRLALAKFDTADATLTPAGACGPCENRTGNQPELPGAPAVGDDLCSKASCFDEKTRAAWRRAAEAADARGVEVIERGRGQLYDVFEGDGVTLTERSPYVALDQKLPAQLARAGAQPKTFGELLGKRAGEVRRVLVQDGNGAPRELVDREGAVAILRELGKVDAPEPPPRAKPGPASVATSSPKGAPRDETERQRREEHVAFLKRLERDVIVEASKGIPERKALAWWRWVIGRLCHFANLLDDHPLVAGLDRRSPWAEQIVEKATTATKAQAIVTALLFCDLTENASGAFDVPLEDVEDSPMLVLVKLLGIDIFKVAKEVTATLRADEKPKAKPAPKRKGRR